MGKKLSSWLIAGAALLLVGCSTTIPPKLQVRDVSSGRTYTTYQTWGNVEQGRGYEFTDIETGNRINLTNYEIKTITGPQSVPNNSPEANAYKQAEARGGIKQ